VDRCALFVDAGYVLADGAMAVHGTRRRESVSWDYAGLLQLLTSLATERSGLPLLRCYWYEATVEGRRSADHDTLADLPSVKLRVAKMRPGRREGVESEIHRDLTALARNKAVSDAMVISAEEDLAQVIADVQDLGLRVTLLHIAVDGNWTISRTLRQECDDLVEIGSAHLRPYVELISGAEPPYPHERDGAPLIALRPTANGNAQAGRTASYAPPSAGLDNGHKVPPSIYTAPVVAEYQRSAPQSSRPYSDDGAVAREDPQAQGAMQDPPARLESQSARQDVALAQPDGVDAPPEPTVAAADYLDASPDLGAAAFDQAQARQDPVHDLQNAGLVGDAVPAGNAAPAGNAVPIGNAAPAGNAVPIGQDQPALPLRGDPAAVHPAAVHPAAVHPAAVHPAAVPQEPQPARQDYDARPDLPMRPDAPVQPDAPERPEFASRQEPEFVSRQELYAAPVAVHAPAGDQPVELPGPRSRQPADLSGYNPGAVREQLPWDAMVTREPLPGEPGDGRQPVPFTTSSAQIRRLPTRGGQSTPAPGQPPPAQPSPGQPPAPAPMAAQPAIEQPAGGRPPAGHRQHAAPVMPIVPGAPDAGGAGGAAAGAAARVATGGATGSAAGVAAGSGYAAAHNSSFTGPRPFVPAGPGADRPAGPGIPAGPAGPVGLAGQVGGQPGGPGGQPPPGPAITAGSIGPPSHGGQGPGPGQGNVAGRPSGPVGPGAPVGPVGPMAYSGPQPAFSLGDAVHSAHQEGQAFGESVARDAPALWLEAVLARKPRMPSDLEARLLQGSALPIDFLLHDEVRHALRRGFWDALERARR
jgi:uncharacterized LabA/DUF88 family protein